MPFELTRMVGAASRVSSEASLPPGLVLEVSRGTLLEEGSGIWTALLAAESAAWLIRVPREKERGETDGSR